MNKTNTKINLQIVTVKLQTTGRPNGTGSTSVIETVSVPIGKANPDCLV